MRSVHLVGDAADEIWMMLMADDLKLESTAPLPSRSLLFVVLYLLCLGVPIAWSKANGGDRLSWIGYEVQLDRFALGLTEGRARWAVEWLQRIARDGHAEMDEFKAAVGRLSFVAGALEWEKPFLAPLYAFAALHPRGGLHRSPAYVRLVASFLAERVARRRAYPSVVARGQNLEPFRVDAKAEGSIIGIGGWLPLRGASGRLDKAIGPWFSFNVSEAEAPRAFYRGKPYRTIASLEALAALVGTIVFGDFCTAGTDATITLPGIGDNRGNGYALCRLQSTKYPHCVIVMELACQLKRRGMRLAMEWVPRHLN